MRMLFPVMPATGQFHDIRILISAGLPAYLRSRTFTPWKEDDCLPIILFPVSPAG
jgi:hypothetical protein